MPKRDSIATKARLLKSGLVEFGNNGFSGARTEKIAKRSKCNVRLLYYYYGDKEGLYLACLEKVYSESFILQCQLLKARTPTQQRRKSYQSNQVYLVFVSKTVP